MSSLDAKLVHRCRLPAYPTRLEALATPELLKRFQPPAWLSNREIAAAAGVLLAANAVGCGSSSQSVPSVPGAATVVAPVFEHGLGEAEHWAGALGSPPRAVYLSEEAALSIIREELAAHGLEMSKRGVVFESIRIPHEAYVAGYDWIADERSRRIATVTELLEVDLFDPQRSVAIEYVALEDFVTLGGGEIPYTLIYKDLHAVAVSLAGEVQRQGAGFYFGSFYDPVSYASGLRTSYAIRSPRLRLAKDAGAIVEHGPQMSVMPFEDAVVESRRLLRQQVKDFVDWLKGQGVI